MTKRTYNTPAIEEIRLDNEISLQLSSPTVNESYELKAPRAAAPAQDMETPENDPYQW